MASTASRVRYGVILASMLMAVLLYLDRFCIGIAEPLIRQDLGLTKTQMGWFISAFFWTYALGQVPSGWLADRYGPRITLTLYILIWSFFTAMMGLATGLVMLLVTRAAYGLGQAGAYPTSANIVSRWIPVSSRGTASSMISLGGRFGGAIAPVLTALLIIRFVSPDQSPLLEPDMILDVPEVVSSLTEEDQELSLPIRHIRSTLGESLEGLGETPEPAERVSDLLNQLIQDETFYQPEPFIALSSMDRYATACIKRIRDGESLSASELQRFNRFLLEAIYPVVIEKTYISSWRPVLILYGSLGLVVAAVFWWVVRDFPRVHPWCNEQERALITGDQPRSNHEKVGNIPMVDIVRNHIVRSRSLWLSSVAQIGINIGWIFIVTWFPTYLLEQYQVPIVERGIMVMVPMFVGWFGMAAGGQVTDRLVPLVGLKWGRRIPWILSASVAATAFAMCPWTDHPWEVTMLMAVVAFCVDFGNPSTWAFNQDVGGNYVGCVLGWANMWGNLGAAVSPILLVYVADTYSWVHMFYLCAAAFCVSGVCNGMIDATVPVIREQE